MWLAVSLADQSGGPVGSDRGQPWTKERFCLCSLGAHPPSVLDSAALLTPWLTLVSHPVLCFSDWGTWAAPRVHSVGAATEEASGETCGIALKC